MKIDVSSFKVDFCFAFLCLHSNLSVSVGCLWWICFFFVVFPQVFMIDYKNDLIYVQGTIPGGKGQYVHPLWSSHAYMMPFVSSHVHV